MMMHSSSKTPVQIFFDYFHHPKLELVLSSFFAGNYAVKSQSQQSFLGWFLRRNISLKHIIK